MFAERILCCSSCISFLDLQDGQVSFASEMMKTRLVSGSFSAWYILDGRRHTGDGGADGSRKDGDTVTETHAHSRYAEPTVHAGRRGSFCCAADRQAGINPPT